MPQTPEHKFRLKIPSPGSRSFILHTHTLLLPVQLCPLHKGAQVFLESTLPFQHFTHSLLMKPIWLSITALPAFLKALFQRLEFTLWLVFPAPQKVAAVFWAPFTILKATIKWLIYLSPFGHRNQRWVSPIFKSIFVQDHPFYSFPLKSHFKN